MRFVLLCTLACSVVSASCSLVTCPDCLEGGGTADANAGPDVLDVGPDVSEPDASSACTACVAPRPHCDESAAACVECINNDHCPQDVECRNGRCPECVDDSDCTTPEAPTCSQSGAMTGQCIPCARNAGCTGIRLSGVSLPVCDVLDGEPNVCVACNGGPDECADFVCDVQERACSDQLEGRTATCVACVGSAQCQDGSVCAQEMFAGTPTGFRCLPSASTGCEVPRVYETDFWMTVEGQLLEVCHLAATTCQGLADDAERCVDSSTCGSPGVDDAVCQEGVDRCTYLCQRNLDCAPEEICSLAVPRICGP